jgi:hypothetical protein
MEKGIHNITTIPEFVTLMMDQFALFRKDMNDGFDKMVTKEEFEYRMNKMITKDEVNHRFEKMEEYIGDEFQRVDKRFNTLEEKVDNKNEVLDRRTNWAVNTVHSILDFIEHKLGVKIS